MATTMPVVTISTQVYVFLLLAFCSSVNDPKVNPDIFSSDSGGEVKLATTNKITQNKKNQAPNVRKFADANVCITLPSVKLSENNSRTILISPMINPPIRVIMAPRVLILLEKIPNRNTAAIGGAI